MYKNMIYDLIKLLEEKHLDCYFNITKEELYNYVDELLKENEIKDEYDFYYYGNKIIKKIFDIYDSHTKLVWKESSNLPIRLKYVDNKVYIIRTDENNKDLLYSEILKINDIDVQTLINEIIDMTAYSTKEFLRMPIEVVLRTIEKLRSLPSINNNAEEFEIEMLRDNQIIKRTLKKQENDLIDINKWAKNYTYKVFDDIVYIVYNSCTEEYKGQMNELIDKIREVSKLNNISKYIVDIRGNAGGNSEVIKQLVEYLKGKEVITLVDEFVFSGGRWTIVDLQNIGSKFVGTGIGTTLNAFGNITRNELEQFIVPISYKYFYLENIDFEEITEREEIEKLKNDVNSKKIFEPVIFKPDYYVKNSVDDIKNGYDRQLEFALSILYNPKKK